MQRDRAALKLYRNVGATRKMLRTAISVHYAFLIDPLYSDI